MKIPAVHIEYEPDLSRRMLVGVVMWPAGAVPQGVSGTVIAAFPAVDILPVGFIFNGIFGNTKFFSVLN